MRLTRATRLAPPPPPRADPRWGRAQETFSEDPFVIGVLGGQFVDGAQRGSDGFGARYLKTIVISKHATAYQKEANRMGSNVRLTPHDLAATYLPAWELAVRCDIPGQGCNSGYMCSVRGAGPRAELAGPRATP